MTTSRQPGRGRRQARRRHTKDVLRADDRGDQPQLRRRAVRRVDPEPHVPGPAARAAAEAGAALRRRARCTGPIHWSVGGRQGDDRPDRPREPRPAGQPQARTRRRPPASPTMATGASRFAPTRPTPRASTPRAGGGFAGPVTASLVLDEGNVTVAKGETPADHRRLAEVHGQAHHRPRRPDHGKARFVLSATGQAASPSASSRSSRPPIRTRRTACGPT